MMPILLHHIINFVQRRFQETQTMNHMSEKFTETSVVVFPFPIVDSTETVCKE